MMRTVTARNITKYEDDGLTTIGTNAFAYCKRFGGDLIFPNVRSIGAYAFQYIDSTVDTGHRITASFPACTAVGSHIFYHANRVTGCSLPLVTSLPERVFEYCGSIVQLDLPLVRTIGAAVFRSIPQCVSLDLPSLTACSGTINFQWNTKMTTITAPNCLIWSTNMFTGSTALKTFDMSNVNSDDFIQANRTAISGESAPNAMNCVFSDKTMTYAQLKTAAASA